MVFKREGREEGACGGDEGGGGVSRAVDGLAGVGPGLSHAVNPASAGAPTARSRHQSPVDEGARAK